MIRVIIERHIKEAGKGELIHLLRELRTSAVHQPGYISGETLSSIEDASVVSVLSTWQNLKSWEKWAASEVRTRLERQIEPLLTERPKVSIYQVTATE